METHEERHRLEGQQIREIESIFRKIGKLLDDLPNHPELAERIVVRVKALQQQLREIERARGSD
jgi:hypothetical protein